MGRLPAHTEDPHERSLPQSAWNGRLVPQSSCVGHPLLDAEVVQRDSRSQMRVEPVDVHAATDSMRAAPSMYEVGHLERCGDVACFSVGARVRFWTVQGAPQYTGHQN